MDTKTRKIMAQCLIWLMAGGALTYLMILGYETREQSGYYSHLYTKQHLLKDVGTKD